MAVDRNDPYAAFNFRVTITPRAGNEVRGAFSDVSGLSTEVTYADYREGTDARNHARKVPTVYKVGDITLKRGVMGKLDLFQWMELVRTGNQDARATVVIQMLAEDGTDAAMWTLTNARPSKWTGPTFGATSTNVAMEELVLVAEDMQFE